MRRHLFVRSACVWMLTVGLCLPVALPSSALALAPAHRNLKSEQFAAILSVLAKKIPDETKRKNLIDSMDRWLFLVPIFGHEKFLRWLENLTAERVDLLLAVLPDLQGFFNQASQVIAVSNVFFDAQKRGLTKDQLVQLAWLMGHHPRVVRKIGLVPFLDFVVRNQDLGLLSLTAVFVRKQAIRSSGDLVRSALAAEEMIQHSEILQKLLRGELASRSRLGREDSSVRKSLENAGQLVQSTFVTVRKQIERRRMRQYKLGFDVRWARAMDSEFNRLGINRLIEWQFLEYLLFDFQGRVDRDDFCHVVLEEARRAGDSENYHRRMDLLAEKFFMRLQLGHYLEPLRETSQKAQSAFRKEFKQLREWHRMMDLGPGMTRYFERLNVLKDLAQQYLLELDTVLTKSAIPMDPNELEKKRREFAEKGIPILKELVQRVTYLKQLLAETSQRLEEAATLLPILDRIRYQALSLMQMARVRKVARDRVEAVRLDALMRNVLRGQHVSEKIKFQIKDLQAVQAVRCSPQRMQLVLSGLLRNALESVGQGDTVALSTKVQDGAVILEVKDSWSWNSSEILPVLFGHGWPLWGTSNGDAETALKMKTPLAMCRHLVEEMGGFLEVESQRGEGTTVRIRFPLPEIQQSERLPKDLVLGRCLALAGKTREHFIFPELVFWDGFWRIRDREKKDRELNHYVQRANPRFVDRDVLQRRIERFPREDMSFWELHNLMRAADWEDSNTIGNFESLGAPKGILSKLSSIFYDAYGPEVFRAVGGIPFKVTNDPVLMRTVAQKLHERLKSVPSGETFVMHVWGFGGILDGVNNFADELERLDREHNTRHVDKLRCVVSDKVVKMVESAKREAENTPLFSDWIRRGILSFRILDAMNPPQDIQSGSIDLVFSGYLYDSLPQRLIVQRKTNLYELKVRPIVKPYPVYRRNGESVSWIEFRNMILNEDIQGLVQLAPRSFANIEFEHVLVPLELSKEPQLSEQLGPVETWPVFSVVPLGEGMMTSVRKSLDLLKPAGEIWSFDEIIARRRDLGKTAMGYRRSLGGIFATIDGRVIEKQMSEKGVPVKIESAGHWLQTHYADPMMNLDNLRRLDALEARNYFPVRLLRNYQEIEALSQTVLAKEGRTPQGQKSFLYGLRTILGESFVIDKLDSGGTGNYLDDLQITIARKVLSPEFRAQALRDTLWIGKKFSNEAFLQTAEGLGFDQRIVQHLLSMRDQLSVRNIFSLVRIGPVNAKAEDQAVRDVDKAIRQASPARALEALEKGVQRGITPATADRLLRSMRAGGLLERKTLSDAIVSMAQKARRRSDGDKPPGAKSGQTVMGILREGRNQETVLVWYEVDEVTGNPRGDVLRTYYFDEEKKLRSVKGTLPEGVRPHSLDDEHDAEDAVQRAA